VGAGSSGTIEFDCISSLINLNPFFARAVGAGSSGTTEFKCISSLINLNPFLLEEEFAENLIQTIISEKYFKTRII
jgi:hypothetical protein